MASMLQSMRSTAEQFIANYPYALPATKLLFGITEPYPGPSYDKDELKHGQMPTTAGYIVAAIYFGGAYIPWALKLYKMSKEPQPPKFEITTNKAWIGMGMSLIGAALRIFSRLWIGKRFTYSLTIRKDHALVTNGPYRIVRHPGYTGLMLWYIGDAIYFGNKWAYFYAAQMVYVQFHKLPYEEKMLHEAFGKEWEDYIERTKAKLIPFVY